MPHLLVMSQKERDRLAVLKQVIASRLSAQEAAGLLALTRRQVFRLLERYREEGDAGLIHRLRGRPSNHGYPKKLKEQVLELYWRPEYRDYGPTLFSEVLARDHKLFVHRETMRRWLMASGGSNVQRKKRPHRKKRPRKTAIGELVQFDGSDHDWFEGRGPSCTLLHLIDDATGRIFLRFVPSENTADCMRTFRAYVERYGLPRCLYTDRGSVFWAEGGTLTDFARAMATLHVQIIYANSPQAKGRVERGNRTQQDRLVKALRREGISTAAAANRFLSRSYLRDHNRRFALPQDHLPDVHRPLDRALKLDEILCFQITRYLNYDYTVTLEGTYIQILKGPYALPRPTSHVILRRYLDDSLHIFDGQQELRFEILEGKPAPRKPPLVMPAPTHPWRHKLPIGKAKRRRYW
jgi:transposase